MIHFNKFGKETLIYGFGGILSKSIGFILIPVYTRIFTPSDYGTLEMMAVIISFISAILTMGLDSAQSFFFFEQKKYGIQKQKKVITTILQWRIFWGVIVITIASMLSPLLNIYFFEQKLSFIFFITAFLYALFNTVMSQSIEIFRLLYRPWPYVIIGLIHSIISGICILTLVLYFKQGVFGYFAGSFIATLLLACLSWLLSKDYIDFSTPTFLMLPKILKFGLPLLPASLAFYAMNTMDRWFIQYFHGAEMLGIYAVGTKFALILAIGVETFRKAWWPLALDSMHKNNGEETFRMIGRLYISIGVCAVTGLTIISPWLIRLITPKEFHSAWPIVGILSWQSLFYGFYLIACAGIWKEKKTYITMYLMTVSAGLNMILNYILVPKFGGIGAAIATSTTYLTWVIITMIISERFWRIQFPYKIFFIHISISMLICIIYMFYQTFSNFWILIFIGFVFIIILFSGLPLKQQKTLLTYFKIRM